MLAAHSLVHEYKANQADVAKVLGCSQSTVANWTKEVAYRREIHGLKQEIDDAKGLVKKLSAEIDNLYLEHNEREENEMIEDDESDAEYIPPYGYEDDDDNCEHALDDYYKVNDM